MIIEPELFTQLTYACWEFDEDFKETLYKERVICRRDGMCYIVYYWIC
jgi:hypothetical protein